MTSVMRLAVALIAMALVIGFSLGQVMSPAAAPAGHVYTGREGDVFLVSAAAARCAVGQEGGAPNLICAHAPDARYSVVFYKDGLFVYRNGRPDNPVFSARRKP